MPNKNNTGNNSYIKYMPKILHKEVSLRSLVMLAVFSLALLFVISRFAEFSQSLESLKDSRWQLVLVAVIFSISTYIFASFSYKSLVYNHIRFKKMFIIQLASSFATKLLPVGAGGIALNTRFLANNKHTITQAAAIAGINNMMGFVAHISLLLVVILVGSSSIGEAFNFNISFSSPVLLIVLISFVASVAALSMLTDFRKRLVKIFKQIIKDLKVYKKHPQKLMGSYLASIGLTFSYVCALYASAIAVNLTISPLQAMVVFSAGAVAVSITPTPGGIGGVEAALIAALSATGVETSQALAVTLLYRLVTYWLPIMPGFIAFQYSANKKYI